MSINIGASPIVKDGLVLSLDASSSLNYNLQDVEVLVVAGGGGGGANHAGGGGGGGLIYRNSHTVTPGTPITVTVGNGGATASSSVGPAATNGQNSVFDTLAASGGGGGGNRNDSAGTSPGRDGGSGGGGGGAQVAFAGNYTPGNGVIGQGFPGGRAVDIYGGGGGGAGGKGFDGIGATLLNSGNGGPGLLYNISGSPKYYAGGGGAGYGGNVGNGKGGVGGGGNGGIPAGDPGTPGEANTGGGGGGGGAGGQPGSSGGSGVVIVRYPGPQKATGGNTITQVGGYTIHTFTSSGTFTPLAVPANNGAVYGLQDLSGNNNTGTQSGGVTYSSANGGSLNFDGSNDIITITSTGIVTNNISVDIWFNVNSAKAYAALLGSNAMEKYEMLIKTASNLEISLSPGNYIQHNNILSINTWTNIVVSASNGVAWKVYKNGIDLETPSIIVGTYQISGTGVNNIDQGRIRNDVGSFAFSGNIASTKIYNRALTAAEVSQNFNALRGRFGI